MRHKHSARLKDRLRRQGVLVEAESPRVIVPKKAYGQPCPLCKSPLAKGERVHSVVFKGPVESFVEVYGCPACKPDAARPEAARAKRICPVCKQELEKDGYVVGRMFKKNEVNHLRILGCTRCRTVR